MKKRLFSIAIRIVFVLLAAGLLAYTVRHTGANVVDALKHGARAPLAAALLLYGFAQVLGAWRWKILLDVQNLRLDLWTALKLTLVGNFFSLIIPGSVTGDILKIACATQKYPGKATELTLVDLIDRIIGLSGIFFAAALATLATAGSLRSVLAAPGSWMIGLAILAINLGCLGSIVLFILYRTQDCWMAWKPVRRLLDWGARHAPGAWTRIRQRLSDALGLYRNHSKAILGALLLSVCVHLTVSGTIFCLGRALHEQHMTPGQYVLTTQLANVTGLLPITPGGIGLRDAVSAKMFETFQADPASVRGDIPLINSLIIVFWGLMGALIYAFSPALKAIENQTSRAPGSPDHTTDKDLP